MTNKKKPVLLCILDGWGIGEKDANKNAIFKAKTPNFDAILQQYPNSKLHTSGIHVGLPDGQMGNSEVGHITIGSGRVIYQDLPRINKDISCDELKNNQKLQDLIKKSKQNSNLCHLAGLLSDGGVHSHQEHITYLAKILAKNGLEVKIHAFLDGRDVAQKSAILMIEKFENNLKEYPNVKIATISGRYWSMDRDNKWDRIKAAYDVMKNEEGKSNKTAIELIEESYKEGITDEFVKPVKVGDFEGMKDGDSLLISNFRADRIRQISQALIDPNFREFDNQQVKFCSQIAMTQYSKNLDQFFSTLYEPIEVKESLGEILQKEEMTQLRIAETEKYAHVTFFFSAGQEAEFKGEDRILVKSPDVKTYDLMPEMSAHEVGKNLKEAIESQKYDFIVVNYANPDMVGHSGVFESSIKACEVIDEQLGMLKEVILQKDGHMLISADHGNIENMITDDNKPHTQHTTNPVPFILIANNTQNLSLEDGTLADIAPTILDLLSLKKPNKMSGKSLILKK